MIASQRVSFFGASFAFGVFLPEAPEFIASDSAALFLPFFFDDSSVSTSSSVSCVLTTTLAFFARGLLVGFFAAFPLISLFIRSLCAYTSQNANTMSSASSAYLEANCITLSFAPAQ
jgi:hypothetical protein